jgi:hypothetical protein
LIGKETGARYSRSNRDAAQQGVEADEALRDWSFAA